MYHPIPRNDQDDDQEVELEDFGVPVDSARTSGAGGRQPAVGFWDADTVYCTDSQLSRLFGF
jgi:hypothetical protein